MRHTQTHSCTEVFTQCFTHRSLYTTKFSYARFTPRVRHTQKYLHTEAVEHFFFLGVSPIKLRGWVLKAGKPNKSGNQTRLPKSLLYNKAYYGSNTTPSKKRTQRQKDDMQIPQPDLRIVPRKKDNKNNRTGPEPKAKTQQAATSSIERAFNPTMQENRNMQFKLIANKILIKFSVNGQQCKKVKHKRKLLCTRKTLQISHRPLITSLSSHQGATISPFLTHRTTNCPITHSCSIHRTGSLWIAAPIKGARATE